MSTLVLILHAYTLKWKNRTLKYFYKQKKKYLSPGVMAKRLTYEKKVQHRKRNLPLDILLPYRTVTRSTVLCLSNIKQA